MTAPAAVEECRLINDRRTRSHGVGGELRGECDVVCVDLGHRYSGPQGIEVTVFVLETLAEEQFQSLVITECGLGQPSARYLHVERGQVGTRDEAGEIGRADDQPVLRF